MACRGPKVLPGLAGRRAGGGLESKAQGEAVTEECVSYMVLLQTASACKES